MSYTKQNKKLQKTNIMKMFSYRKICSERHNWDKTSDKTSGIKNYIVDQRSKI